MAVDHAAGQTVGNTVELIAEHGHLISTVLIAGDDLVNGINDNGSISGFLGSPDELWCKLVHRFRLATQVPDVNVLRMRLLDVQCLVHVIEAVQTAVGVQLKVDVENLALCALKTHPF